MKKRKVLQLCHDTKGPFVALCAMYLKGFDLNTYEVHTVFLRGDYSEDCVSTLQGSSVHFLAMKSGALRGLKVKAIAKVLRLCRQQGFELIIAHRYKAIYVAGIASLFTPVKVWGVAHTHNVFTRFGRKLFVEYWRKNIKLIGVSESVATNILDTCPGLANQNRVFSLPNCLAEETESLLLPKESARAQLGLDNDTYVFGTIGRLVSAKDHDILLKAYAHAELANTKLVIVGDGPKLAELEQLAMSLNIQERVIFAGFIPQALKILKAFDVFVFSSNEEEAFGVAVLEAMMAKIPIISSNAKGPVEAVGDTGLIFKQSDSSNLAEKLCLAHQMGSQESESLGKQGYNRWLSHYTSRQFKQRFSALLGLSTVGDR